MEAQQPDRRWIILAVFAALAVIVVGVILISRSGGDGDGDATTASGGAKGGCEKVAAPAPKNVSFDEPEQVVAKGEKASAVVATSCGEFTIALDTERAPKTSNSFAFLAEEGFFDETTFSRIVQGFVIQGGEPERTGPGPGYSVVEAPPGNLRYTKGIVAMAKTETEAPGTSGGQFFVVTAAPEASLPPEYALVGEVTSGYDVVERIEKQGTPEETAKQTILIESVTIEKE